MAGGLESRGGVPFQHATARRDASPRSRRLDAAGSRVDDHAPLIERAFTLEPHEGTAAVDDVKGRVPPWVRGTCFLNGPARFARGSVRYRHWLDGDGMVCALDFSRE